jgi:DNA invertase Pin-like site-specific DNA recombinase
MHEYAGYWRKSVGRKGIAQQRKITTAFIERDGGAIVFERDDKDKTAFRHGEERPPRPGFDDVLAALRARPGLRLAAWHIDRITRDVEDAEDVIRTRCVVVTASGAFYDLSAASGRKQFRQDVVDAQFEVDHSIERMRERKDEHAAEGRWMGGPVPFGWRAVPREDPDEPALLELDDAEHVLLCAAKDAVLCGRALNAIGAEWNAAGWRTRRGNPWHITTVRQVLTRPRNAGLHQHRGQVAADAQWPPLWDTDTHTALVALLSDPARRNGPGNARRYLLSGIALCGTDGALVRVHISSRVPYYACSRSASHPMRRVERVDELVTELVLRRLEMDDAAGLLREDSGAGRGELLARRGRTEGLMRASNELRRQGLLTDAEFAEERRDHLRQLEEVRAGLEALNRADALAPFLAAPRKAWAAADLDSRRAVVSALVAVTLFPGRAGRPRGWSGGPYFDYESVDVRWLRRLPSDG